MKKLSICLSSLMLLLLVACTSKEKSGTTKSNESENINAKTRAVYKAIETGDVSGLDSILDENFVDHTVMGDINGRDSVKAMLADIHNHFEGLKFDILAQANDGEYHFSLININGTVKDDYMGMKAGTKLDMKGIDLVKIKNGKAVEHWDFMASSDMAKMMPGTMPADTTAQKPGSGKSNY